METNCPLYISSIQSNHKTKQKLVSGYLLKMLEYLFRSRCSYVLYSQQKTVAHKNEERFFFVVYFLTNVSSLGARWLKFCKLDESIKWFHFIMRGFSRLRNCFEKCISHNINILIPHRHGSVCIICRILIEVK